MIFDNMSSANQHLSVEFLYYIDVEPETGSSGDTFAKYMENTMTTSNKTKKHHDHINQGAKHADAAWRKAALAEVGKLAKNHGTFTSAEVLAELEKSKEVHTHDLRAIGCVMMQARNLGMIESAGLIRRNDKHTRAATTVWRSKLYTPTQQSAPETQPHTAETANVEPAA